MTDERTLRVARAIAETVDDHACVYPVHIEMARAAIEAYEAAPQPAPALKQPKPRVVDGFTGFGLWKPEPKK